MSRPRLAWLALALTLAALAVGAYLARTGSPAQIDVPGEETGAAPEAAPESTTGATTGAMVGGEQSFALLQGLHDSARIEITTPTGPCETASRQLLAALEEGHSFGGQLNPPVSDPGAVRVLVGVPASEALAPLARRCGVEPLEAGFRFLGRDYLAPGDALVAVFEDPAHPGRPLCLFLGNDPEPLAVYLTEIPCLSRPHLTVWADGDPALECPLAQDGTPRVADVVDRLARRQQRFEGAPKRSQLGITVVAAGELDRELWQEYGLSLAHVQRQLAQWLGEPGEGTAEVYLYSHPEEFLADLGFDELSVANRLHPRVYALLSPGRPHDEGRALAEVLAREVLGEPQAAWMRDGLSVAATERWWGRPLVDWVAALGKGKVLPAVVQLVKPNASGELSEHVLLPARGVLFRVLVTSVRQDPRAIRALWHGGTFPLNKLEAGFRAVLARSLSKGAGDAPGNPGAPGSPEEQAAPGSRDPAGGAADAASRPARRGGGLLAGVALVEEPGAEYSARAVGPALDELVGLGADAVSLTVLASIAPPLPPLCTLAPRPLHSPTTSLGLANACAEAEARGLRVALALEALYQPWGSWLDCQATPGPSNATFWSDYRTLVLHYACLGELLGVEVFSLGANLSGTARTEVEEDAGVREEVLAWRRAGWTKLIACARSVYHGGLTYCARFPAESRTFGEWDALDFVGLSFFPWLARPDRVPDDAELRRLLRQGLQEALDQSLRWNRPLLLLQAGFPARADSWNRPWVPRGERDPAAQERYLAALADVLEGKLPDARVLRGLFLWCWPVAEPGVEPGDFCLRVPALSGELGRVLER